eukprot:TRINITY_DN1667_c7_g1_i1.p1 TRINITY_DN1667_c7_g1~~TRINITY_DN1667_c7_g1_i1.p1  ORF type:complete len:255 (+),score=89.45 TRINITY_DN1667_c7_g1_i1:332-1096(+)
MQKRKWLLGGAPKMSFKTLYMNGEFPPFFGWIGVEKKICGSGEISFDSELRQTQLDNLWDAGVRGIITLTENGIGGGTVEAQTHVESRGFEYAHLPTIDLTAPTLTTLLRGCEFIEQVDGAVLVHCREGVGRTGTLLAAWLVYSNGLDADTACEQVRTSRSGSIHKKTQEQMVYRFHRLLDCPSLRADVAAGEVDEDTLAILDETFDASIKSPTDPFDSIQMVSTLVSPTDSACCDMPGSPTVLPPAAAAVKTP